MPSNTELGKQRRSRGETQKIILEFIRDQIAMRGYPPSVREICDAVGLKSTSTVHGHLKRLESKGQLRRDAMKPRSMEILDGMSSGGQDLISVPLLGPVAAGSPILAEEDRDDQISLPAFMVGSGDHFALAVRGDSMMNAGILNGDYIVVHKQSTANNGEIVVAMVQGDATVKRFYKENGHFRLLPDNPAMAPIYTPSVDVLGKVVSVFRVLK